jgi:hypothetical protein
LQIEVARVFVDGDAIDVIHREIGASLRRFSGIQEAGDARMLKRRQDLAFLQEPVA